MSSFCKSSSHFCSKNVNVFENTLATIVNEFLINELVKLTKLWSAGPCIFYIIQWLFKQTNKTLIRLNICRLTWACAFFLCPEGTFTRGAAQFLKCRWPNLSRLWIMRFCVWISLAAEFCSWLRRFIAPSLSLSHTIIYYFPHIPFIWS